MVGAVATVLGTLLKYFPKGSYYILTSNLMGAQYGLDPGTALECEYFLADLPEFLVKRRWNRFLLPIYDFLQVPIVVWKGIELVRSRKVGNILVAVTPDRGIEIAAFLVHKLTGKPLYIYLFDIYAEAQTRPLHKVKARLLEERLLRSAACVFVMSEHLQKHLISEHSIRAEVIPHPIEIPQGSDAPQLEILDEPPDNRREYRIVYTGMIYDAHLDSVLNLVHALDCLDGINIKLAIYTPRPPERLAKLGIRGDHVTFHRVPHSNIASVQRDADILFLPLAFNSSYPELIKTASPGKLPEYLAAGKPILVHAPACAYISQYARQQGFGLVVDTLDPAELQRAIRRLLSDQGLRHELVLKARRALTRHEATSVSHRLQKHLGVRA
jgi:glycosyltransferase involved in cell wall biosynthesis